MGGEGFAEALMENDIQSEKPRKAGAMKTAALVIGVLAVGTVMSLTGRNSPNQCGCIPPRTEPGEQQPHDAARHGDRPRLLDLGATTCIPCKKMAPVLEELKREYEGKLDVEFIDVWRMPGVANQYGVSPFPRRYSSMLPARSYIATRVFSPRKRF